MIEVSLRLLPPDPRWLDFAGFVAPIADPGEDSALETRADERTEGDPAEASRSRKLVSSAADR